MLSRALSLLIGLDGRRKQDEEEGERRKRKKKQMREELFLKHRMTLFFGHACVGEE